jgi:hypothetical protein
MSKIIINNVEFPYNEGCGILKLKHKTECPMEQLNDIWDDIIPLTFKEISQFQNLEQRRIGISLLGIDEIIRDVNPKLISSETIKKTTTWINENGDLVEHKFDDTYELYEVEGTYFSAGLGSYRTMDNSYYVKCKDTSTDREYMIWVDLISVHSANGGIPLKWGDKPKPNAIQCIAWTIQTDIPEGSIEKIVRQGDCIMIKPTADFNIPLNSPRHLSEKEYRELIIAES